MQIKQEEHWDTEISTKRGFFDLRLKQVWKYRYLLVLFVRRDFVSFYKQTVLGPIWFFIQPIFTTIVYVFLFGTLASLSTDGIPAPLFYIAGITTWTYFSDCLIKTSTVFRDNTAIFGKVYFPRLIMPLSITISSLVKFFVQLLLLTIMIIFFSIKEDQSFVSINIVFFPAVVLIMGAQGMGLGLLVTAVSSKYRDIAMLLTFGIQLLMFATPIVYPLSSISGKLKLILQLNPMTTVVEMMRLGFLGKGTVDMFGIVYTILITISVLFLGVLVFNKVEKSFVDTI
jgi:lipopolysaccharide transport system permease protein